MLADGLNVGIKVNVAPTKSGSKSSKKEDDKYKEAFEKKYDALKRQLEREEIDTKTFYEDLMALNEEYFGESSGVHEKYLEEWQKYDDEVFSKQQEWMDECLSNWQKAADHLKNIGFYENDDDGYLKAIEKQKEYLNSTEELLSYEEELYKIRKEWTSEWLDMTKSIYDNQISAYDNYISRLQSMQEMNSNPFDTSIIEKENQAYADQLDMFTKKYNAMQNQLKSGLASGIITEGSDEWREMAQAVDDTATSITQAKLKQFADEMKSNWISAVKDLMSAQTSIGENIIDSLKDSLDTIQDQYEGLGGNQIYEQLISSSTKQIDVLKRKVDEIKNQMSKGVSSGLIKQYDSDWSEMYNSIQDCNSEINDLTASVKEYEKALTQLSWNKFDLLLEKLTNVSDEIGNIQSVLSNADLYNDDGSLTNEGLTSQGLYAQKREESIYEQQRIQEALNELQEQYNSGIVSEIDFQTRKYDLLQSQNTVYQAQADAEQAILNMQKEGYQAKIDALNKENEARQEAYDLEQKQLVLQDALNNRNQKKFDATTGEIVYTNNASAVKTAENDLANAENSKATNDLQQKIDDIENIMGQVDVRTTMQCYNHVDVERAKRELDKLGSLQENLHQILHQIM